MPLVLGGDHSLRYGDLARCCGGGGRPIGLLWIDAHLDAHTPQTSHSGQLHGMPLAALLGQAAMRCALADAALAPRHVCVVGVRSFEAEEAALLAALGVRVYPMAEIGARGLARRARRSGRARMDGTVATASRSISTRSTPPTRRVSRRRLRAVCALPRSCRPSPRLARHRIAARRRDRGVRAAPRSRRCDRTHHRRADGCAGRLRRGVPSAIDARAALQRGELRTAAGRPRARRGRACLGRGGSPLPRHDVRLLGGEPRPRAIRASCARSPSRRSGLP